MSQHSSQQQLNRRARTEGRKASVCVRGILGLLCLALGILGHFRMQNQAKAEQSATLISTELHTVSRVLGFEKARTITRGNVLAVHSATAVELPNRRIRSYWFGGTREGARDVSIWTALWDGQTWGEPQVAIDRLELEVLSGLNIRKLGNPVAHRTVNGDVELYFVGVAMGGWSGSAVYHARSSDGGITFGQPKRLLVSPFVNISTLVKAPALDDADGGVLLPVYHEFTGKFPQMIRLDRDRRVVSIASVRSAKGLIQPWVLHDGGGKLRMFTRRTKHNEHKRVHSATSNDGGRTWNQITPMELANPNASVAAVRVKEGTLIVCNDKEKGRDSLRIFFQPNDDQAWRFIHEIDGPEHEADESKERINRGLEYSYPWMMQTRDGSLHVFYTWNRRQIRHFRFDARDWKESEK